MVLAATKKGSGTGIEIKDLYYRIQNQVVTGAVSPEDGTKNFIKECNEILARS